MSHCEQCEDCERTRRQVFWLRTFAGESIHTDSVLYGDCFSDETLRRRVEGNLTDYERALVDNHLRRCQCCRGFLGVISLEIQPARGMEGIERGTSDFSAPQPRAQSIGQALQPGLSQQGADPARQTDSGSPRDAKALVLSQRALTKWRIRDSLYATALSVKTEAGTFFEFELADLLGEWVEKLRWAGDTLRVYLGHNHQDKESATYYVRVDVQVGAPSDGTLLLALRSGDGREATARLTYDERGWSAKRFAGDPLPCNPKEIELLVYAPEA